MRHLWCSVSLFCVSPVSHAPAAYARNVSIFFPLDSPPLPFLFIVAKRIARRSSHQFGQHNLSKKHRASRSGNGKIGQIARRDPSFPLARAKNDVRINARA